MSADTEAPRGQWMTLPIYSRKLHFFTLGPAPEAARPSLCPQFYSSFMSRRVANPKESDMCKTCRDRLAKAFEAAKARKGRAHSAGTI